MGLGTHSIFYPRIAVRFGRKRIRHNVQTIGRK